MHVFVAKSKSHIISIRLYHSSHIHSAVFDSLDKLFGIPIGTDRATHAFSLRDKIFTQT